jgi:hypothetical protein
LKKSFALLLAIVFVVVLGTVGALMAYFSSATLKQTGDDYLRAQEGLSAKSATEFAIQALQSRDFATNGCINKIDINGSLFDINMTFHYFLTDCSNCDGNCSIITTQESNGTVMINTYVTSKVDPNIRFFRQTLQKP